VPSPEPVVVVPAPPKPSVELVKVHGAVAKKEQLRRLLDADEDNWTPTGGITVVFLVYECFLKGIVWCLQSFATRSVP